jgi:ribonucleoside-diphosphate reductase alpha chain
MVELVNDRVLEQIDPIPLELVAKIIENVLMESGWLEAARKHIQYREARALDRAARMKPDSKALEDYIFIAKYSRYLHGSGKRETWDEAVDRVRDMHLSFYDGEGLGPEIRECFELVRDKKILPSMRTLQFGGLALERNHERMYNCSFTLINRVSVFREVMHALMSGCGVGYSVQKCHVSQLPIVEPQVNGLMHYEIEDTLEGWADAIDALVKGCFGGYYVEFSYAKIRAVGMPLVVSGGKAPGHFPLKIGLEQIRSVFKGAEGRRLRPIEVHDILCFIAKTVLSGGIRRSAMIALFSPEDSEMLYSKCPWDFHWDGINAQRSAANNSVVLDPEKCSRPVFDEILGISGSGMGEPGIFWTRNSDYGCNPCGEIGLDPGVAGMGYCNLVAGYSDVPNSSVLKEQRLIGVSLTGVMDNPGLLQSEILREGAELVKWHNNSVSKHLGFSESMKCTTIKPSGTASLVLGGVSNGIHPNYAHRFRRRVTANPQEAHAAYYRGINPGLVETKPNGDWALSFLVERPSGSITWADYSALEFLETLKMVTESWIKPGERPDYSGPANNISATCMVEPGELDSVVDYLWENKETLRAVTLAPADLGEVYPYAPLERLSEGEWNRLIRISKRVQWGQFQEATDGTVHSNVAACEGQRCSIQ